MPTNTSAEKQTANSNATRFLNVLLFLFLIAHLPSAHGKELESIQWSMDQAEAKILARKSGKPIMRVILKSKEPLSENKALTHPFVIDAAKLFVP